MATARPRSLPAASVARRVARAVVSNLVKRRPIIIAALLLTTTLGLFACASDEPPRISPTVTPNPLPSPAVPVIERVAARPGAGSDSRPTTVSVGSWSEAPGPQIARSGHIAVRLKDGRILVAGGRNAHGILDSAEIFDPSDDTWTPSGRMVEARTSPQAVLLNDGRVLVTGGSQESPISSAEIFDPASGAWSTVPEMSSARVAHISTLLGDGRVLVAGGWTGRRAADSVRSEAEMFDPEAGTWSPAPDLPAPRLRHAAVSLENGRVLVTGGLSSARGRTSNLSSALLFDPDSENWTEVASMKTARARHTMTALAGGKVLVSGGGATGEELYDPDADEWMSAGAMNVARESHTATALSDGRLLVSGGTSRREQLAFAEVFDPEAGEWKSAGAMQYRRVGHTATLLQDGRVLVVGGEFRQRSSIVFLSPAEIYDPEG